MTSTATSVLAKESTDKANANQSPKQQLSVQKIFNKGLVFEAASLTPELVNSSADANIEMQAFVNTNERENEVIEVVLTLNLTAKVNGSLLWRVQLQQAGFYTLKGFNDEQKKQALNGFCANQLYTYACAIVNNTVTQGGFAPIFLAAMNFEVLYQQQLKQSEKSEVKPIVSAGTTTSTSKIGQH